MHQSIQSYLTVTNLTVFLYNQRNLIKDLSFNLNHGNKIAVIGEEGNGKSTLLKIIASQPSLDNIRFTGQIRYRSNHFGYLPQTIPHQLLSLTPLSFMIYDTHFHQFDWSQLNHYHSLEKSIASLKLPATILDSSSPISSLSGGEQIKLYLAKLLLQNPDFLLLDEPTNNLDLETISWLENFIKQSPLPIIYVSHDLQLLHHTATHILHLEQIKNKQAPKHHFVKSNYEQYIRNRQQKIEWETKESLRQKRQHDQKISKLLSIKNNVKRDQDRIIDSSARRLLNKRMKTILSQQKKLANQDLLPSPDVEESVKINFSLPEKVNPNQKIIDLFLPRLAIDHRILLQDIRLEIKASDKICFTGPNGCGKSTLLQNIRHHLAKINKKTGYFPQTISDFFHFPHRNSIDYVRHYDQNLDETTVRQLLGQLKFTTEEMQSPPLQLSGGQQTKLILLCLSVGKYSILILDEPTRNLSPLSLPVFIDAIKNFPGCLISASHDREFISRVGKNNYQFKNLHLFPFSTA